MSSRMPHRAETPEGDRKPAAVAEKSSPNSETPERKPAAVAENSYPPSEDLAELKFDTLDISTYADLPIRSVEPVGNSPDTPAVQPDNDDSHQQNGIVVESRRREVDDTDIDGRNVRPRLDQEIPLPDGHKWAILTKPQNSTQNFPIGNGAIMLVNGHSVPFQKMGGNPLGIDPQGEYGGWYKSPIYQTIKGKTDKRALQAVATILNGKHFRVNYNMTQRSTADLWERVDNVQNKNLKWHPSAGFIVIRKEGIAELFGGTYQGKKFTTKKQILTRYQLEPDDGWPTPSDVNQWDQNVFPLHVNHPRNLFHGNEGGKEEAEKILDMGHVPKKERAISNVVMNHFYLLNPQLNPPNHNYIALEAEGWLELRNNSEGNEDMWKKIESGILAYAE